MFHTNKVVLGNTVNPCYTGILMIIIGSYKMFRSKFNLHNMLVSKHTSWNCAPLAMNSLVSVLGWPRIFCEIYTESICDSGGLGLARLGNRCQGNNGLPHKGLAAACLKYRLLSYFKFVCLETGNTNSDPQHWQELMHVMWCIPCALQALYDTVFQHKKVKNIAFFKHLFSDISYTLPCGMQVSCTTVLIFLSAPTHLNSLPITVVASHICCFLIPWLRNVSAPSTIPITFTTCFIYSDVALLCLFSFHPCTAKQLKQVAKNSSSWITWQDKEHKIGDTNLWNGRWSLRISKTGVVGMLLTLWIMCNPFQWWSLKCMCLWMRLHWEIIQLI